MKLGSEFIRTGSYSVLIVVIIPLLCYNHVYSLRSMSIGNYSSVERRVVVCCISAYSILFYTVCYRRACCVLCKIRVFYGICSVVVVDNARYNSRHFCLAVHQMKLWCKIICTRSDSVSVVIIIPVLCNRDINNFRSMSIGDCLTVLCRGFVCRISVNAVFFYRIIDFSTVFILLKISIFNRISIITVISDNRRCSFNNSIILHQRKLFGK